MKSQLRREFRARQSSRRSLFSVAFTTGSNYTDHSLPPPHPRPPFGPFHFFTICPPRPRLPPPCSRLSHRHRSTASFLPFPGRELTREGRRTQREPGMNFANGLNSNYPDVSFARSPRSTFSHPSLSPWRRRRPSLCATTPRKTPDSKSGRKRRPERTGNQKSSVRRTSVRAPEAASRVALMTRTWLPFKSLSCREWSQLALY